MKNKSLIIVGALFVTIMIIAVLLYPGLAEKATGNTETTAVSENTTVSESTTKTQYPGYTDVKFFDKNQNAVKLSDFEGKPIIINFWATWCGYCLYEMPDFEEAYKQYGDEIRFLFINTNDSFSRAEKYISENNYTTPSYYDLEYEAYTAYGLSSLPRTVAIDAEGNMIYNRAGMITADILQSIIDAVK